MTIRLPHIAGLDWQPDGHLYSAPTTAEFWDFYYNRVRSRVQALGVSAAKRSDGWYAFFDPSVCHPDVMTAAAIALRAEAFDLQLAASEGRAAAERAQAEDRERRRLAHNAKEEIREAKQIKAQALGRACLEKWGEATSRPKRVRAWVRARRLVDWEISDLEHAVRDTEAKAKRWEQEALTIDGGVDWPDDLVEACIRYMTGLDADHCEEPNRQGWGRAESGRGHWCCAMLDINSEAALAVGRTLLEPYVKRQLKGLIASYWRQREGEVA